MNPAPTTELILNRGDDGNRDEEPSSFCCLIAGFSAGRKWRNVSTIYLQIFWSAEEEPRTARIQPTLHGVGSSKANYLILLLK